MHRSIPLRFRWVWVGALALSMEVSVADVSVGGQVEVTIVETETSQTSRSIDRSIGQERTVKLGIWSALAYNQDAIDSALSEMSNHAVREPIGRVGLGIDRTETSITDDVTGDDLSGSLTIPVGNDFGLTLNGIRGQLSNMNTSDAAGFYLFHGNPKNGSFGLGLTRNRLMNNQYIDDVSLNDVTIGYNWRDADRGTFSAQYKKLLGNSVGADGHEKSITGQIYLDNTVLSARESWNDIEMSGFLSAVGRESNQGARYEAERFTLFGNRNSYKLNLTADSTAQGKYSYTETGITAYPHHNLALTASKYGVDISGQKYQLRFQPTSGKYTLSASMDKQSGSSGFSIPIKTYGLTLTLNLGRKRSIQSADRDRDPF